MKQVLQSIRTGETVVADVPVPALSAGKLLVQVAYSLVSAGTERMVVDFAEKNWLEKARSRPDLVQQTIEKAQREGILTTLEAVQNRLEQPMVLGYSCAGTVLQVGAGVSEFTIGDRVACAGGGYAVHAQLIAVPKNLLVKLPDEADLESAAFTTLGAIALQGIRLAEVKLGEIVAVIGLGLLGQLTVQLLKLAGCVVVGMDIQPDRALLGQQLGADEIATTTDELLARSLRCSSGHGVDAVIITADTKSDQPVQSAGTIARRKGRVVAVGAIGMNIPRKLYYEKELSFHISSSYGPGRYDPTYEEKGQDYPYAYVRWTENRNMQAFVQWLATKQLNLQPLISHRFPIEQAPTAYNLITGKTGQSFLGVLLTYPTQPDLRRTISLPQPPTATNQLPPTPIQLGVLGAGNFANATLLPILKQLPQVELIGIGSGSGATAQATAQKFGFRYSTTDSQQLLQDPQINTVAILTRHHLHAPQLLAAWRAGKQVFVEKPLCLTPQELQQIIELHAQTPNAQLMVGFNRRFAPFITELRQAIQPLAEPLMLHYRVNAGYIPPDHWTQDPNQGGGRLIGEAIHFIDLLIYLAASQPISVTAQALPDRGRYCQDNLIISLTFANGTIGILTYVANGEKTFGKEMLELFGGGLSARLEDYRTLTIQHGKKRIQRVSRLRQNKGHRAEWQAWIDHLQGQTPAPLPFVEVVCTMQTAFAAQQSLVDGGSRNNLPLYQGS